MDPHTLVEPGAIAQNVLCSISLSLCVAVDVHPVAGLYAVIVIALASCNGLPPFFSTHSCGWPCLPFFSLRSRFTHCKTLARV